MRYDLEADWQLLNTCNYRCTYCFFPPELLSEKLRHLPDWSRWIQAFASTGKTWLLNVTGGEPTLHPHFADLCSRLAEDHYLSVNTNLSNDSIVAFAQGVPRARVSLINAALHPEERTNRRGWQIFLKHLDVLLQRGHPVIVSVVATPEVLRDFDVLAKPLQTVGLRPVPKLLRGTYYGRCYPDEYTTEERARFKDLSAWAREGYRRRFSVVDERPTVWPLDDDSLLDSREVFRGRSCDAGHTFVRLLPDGEVYRCGPEMYLGNLLHGTLRLAERAGTCASSYCPYFCKKYVLSEIPVAVIPQEN